MQILHVGGGVDSQRQNRELARRGELSLRNVGAGRVCAGLALVRGESLGVEIDRRNGKRGRRLEAGIRDLHRAVADLSRADGPLPGCAGRCFGC